MTAQIKSKIDQAEIISFDIFDTLLLRSVPHPQDVFTIIAQKYAIENFKKQRIKAEWKAREKTSFCEVTLDEIYAYLPGIKQAYEKSVEEELLFTNQEMMDLYQYAYMRGKRIIAISDMYLDQDFLYTLLDKNGFNAIEKLFVSSTYKATKVNGNLYAKVLEELQIDNPSKLLHIGDNYHSDVKMAKNMGIKAIHYQKRYHYVNLSSCHYKYAVMQQDLESLQRAQYLKLGMIDAKNGKNKKRFVCEIKWFLFRTKNIYFKCDVMGMKQCIQRALKKIIK